MHSPPGGAMVSTRMRPRAFGIDALCSRRGVRALRAASGLVGWRGSDRDPISSTWVARLQKPNFDVLLWAKVASDGLTTAEGSARMINPGHGAMFGASRTSLHSRAYPVVRIRSRGTISIVTYRVTDIVEGHFSPQKGLSCVQDTFSLGWVAFFVR